MKEARHPKWQTVAVDISLYLQIFAMIMLIVSRIYPTVHSIVFLAVTLILRVGIRRDVKQVIWYLGLFLTLYGGGVALLYMAFLLPPLLIG